MSAVYHPGPIRITTDLEDEIRHKLDQLTAMALSARRARDRQTEQTAEKKIETLRWVLERAGVQP